MQFIFALINRCKRVAAPLISSKNMNYIYVSLHVEMHKLAQRDACGRLINSPARELSTEKSSNQDDCLVGATEMCLFITFEHRLKFDIFIYFLLPLCCLGLLYNKHYSNLNLI